ncbi:Zn-ribbon domain-containing OB-fold protein [Bordetella petrii]|uniref:OB-fold domain-containing protein n=1 Tax=Bordetella petrii TaxID=94624 RepID=A0ABT7VY57_9BORD|nr:OB-fold domain-containing protein [Bordetella petrii]MDM9557875.1 OB-fold domain-containing protein [Bordetella petrii]
MIDAMPGPGPQARYFAALAAGRFEIQRCDACQACQFFPRAICMHCGAARLQWFRPSGRGTVYSTSVVRRKPEAGGDYNVALVDLEEGVRLMSRVEGLAPGAVRIGMAVQARIRSDGAEPSLVFVAREEA